MESLGHRQLAAAIGIQDLFSKRFYAASTEDREGIIEALLTGASTFARRLGGRATDYITGSDMFSAGELRWISLVLSRLAEDAIRCNYEAGATAILALQAVNAMCEILSSSDDKDIRESAALRLDIFGNRLRLLIEDFVTVD